MLISRYGEGCVMVWANFYSKIIMWRVTAAKRQLELIAATASVISAYFFWLAC